MSKHGDVNLWNGTKESKIPKCTCSRFLIGEALYANWQIVMSYDMWLETWDLCLVTCE